MHINQFTLCRQSMHINQFTLWTGCLRFQEQNKIGMDQAATVTYVTDILDLFVLGGSGRVLLLGRTCAAREVPGTGVFLGFQWADLEFSVLL